MRRREFIAGLSWAASWTASAWPLAAWAQRSAVPRIGVLVVASMEPLGPFREGLRDLGYVEGTNIHIEIRSAQGEASRLPELAQQFVRDKKDIIVAVLTPAIAAAKDATREIPIVMAPAGDPIGTGFVASLARPGGNITGVSGTGTEANVKTLELIRETVPSVQKVGTLVNAHDPFNKPLLEQTFQAAQSLGIEVPTQMIGDPLAIEAAIAKIKQDGCQALLIQGSLPVQPTADLAMKHRLPSFSQQASFARAGALMAYSSSYAERGHVVASYVDKIIKGAKPGDLPVQQPTKYQLVINLKTAKVLGLAIAPTILARADEVIE